MSGEVVLMVAQLGSRDRGQLALALIRHERWLRAEHGLELPPGLSALLDMAGHARPETSTEDERRVELLSYKAVAARIGRSERTVRRYADRGLLRRVEGRITASSVDEWLQGGS